MALDFNKFAAKGNEFIEDLSKELGYPNDPARAGRVLKSVLHALRRQLTTEESVQLISQFPMFLKAVYVENWTLHKRGRKAKRLEDFYAEILEIDKQAAAHDFEGEDDISNSIAVIFRILRRYISLGELEDLKAVLPKDLKSILNEVTMI